MNRKAVYLKASLLFTLCFTSLLLPAQRNSNVLNYSHTINLSDTSDAISGYSVIDILIEAHSKSLSLDLKNIGANGKGMTVWSAGYKTKGKYFKNFEHSHDKIILTGDFNSGDTISVAVVYKGVPEDGLIISKNKFGKRTFFADNWPNRAHHWIPCVDDPADKATVEFFVFAPDHYKVVGNGMLVQETPMKDKMKLTQWKEDVPLPTKVMVIGVADFAVNLAGMVNDCIPVTSWVYPENIEGFRDYAIAKDILQWFVYYIGPYAYPKLANVQSKTIYGGMENAGAIFYAEQTVNGQRSEERLFAHEIVHQWFGNMATEKSF
ncbi:MAG TPA: M1 family aminopeptidase, partial [Chitinophagaceae bacterium]|nr:M1 family aminopeptidase [Chitinophagaceae bacterium]